MALKFIFINRNFLRALIGVGILLMQSSIFAQSLNDTELVDISGVSNLGPNYNITGFFMNNKYYGSVGRGVGGGGTDCCIGIPKNWRPNMKIVVQWTVNIWEPNLVATASGKKPPKKAFSVYIATVPVEKYERPHTLYIHFFHGGKARIVSSEFGALSPKHPVMLDDPREIKIATQGKEKNSRGGN